MLQAWGAINDSIGNSSEYVSENGRVGETNEAREGRVRDAYASALSLHASGALAEARRAYSDLSKELSEDIQNLESLKSHASSHSRPRKRTRDGNNPFEHRTRLPEWVRTVSYSVLRNLGELLCDNGEYTDGLQAYAGALDIDPGDMIVWLKAGRAALSCGRLHVARRAYERALRLRPGHWLPCKYLRSTLNAIGDADEDTTDSRQDIAFDEDHVDEALCAREKYFDIEKSKANACHAAVPTMEVTDLSWITLVDLLGKELNGRLSCSGEVSVGSSLILMVADSITVGQASVSVCEDLMDKKALDSVVAKNDGQSAKHCDDSMRTVDKTAANSQVATEETPDIEELSCTGKGGSIASQAVQVLENLGGSARPNNDETDIDSTQVKPEAAIHHASDQSSTRDIRKSSVKEAAKAKSNAADKAQELRKSKRQAEMEQREKQRDRLRTRNAGTKAKDSREIDSVLLERMSSFIPVIPASVAASKDDVGCAGFEGEVWKSGLLVRASENLTRRTPVPRIASSDGGLLNWKQRVSDGAEECRVADFIKRSGSMPNGGPIDLLSRIFDELISQQCIQYMPHVARIWLLLHHHCSFLLSDQPANIAFVAESLLISGDKIGKIKNSCYGEAHRLLVLLTSKVDLRGLHSSTADLNANQLESIVMATRVFWLRSQVSHRKGQLQDARDSVQTCCFAADFLRRCGVHEPLSSAGPLLAELSVDDALQIMIRNYQYCELACKLSEARSAVMSADAVENACFARQAIRTLSTNIRQIETHLEFDNTWQVVDEISCKRNLSCISALQSCYTFIIVDEVGSKKLSSPTEANDMVQDLLEVYLQACSLCGDASGELWCLAIMLKLLVVEHQLQEAAESIPDLSVQNNRLFSEYLGKQPSSAKLSSIVANMKKIATSIKNVCSARQTLSETDHSAFSPVHAIVACAKSLVSAACAFLSRIPTLPGAAAGPVELTASQKNQRLALTRVMLGFSRCVGFLVHYLHRSEKCQSAQKSVGTPDILDVLHFSLCLLVPRGCVREEGTSGALIKLYLCTLTERLYEMAASDMQRSAQGSANMISEETGAVSLCRGSREGLPENAGSPINLDGSDDSKQSDGESDVVERVDWDDVEMVRSELAQCYRCLYKLSDLEALTRDGSGDETRWLLDGCSLSQRLGLSSASGDASTGRISMDVDTCRGAFCFYRKHLFKGLKNQWREGKKSRRARVVTAEIAESMPVDPPAGVPSVPLLVLDEVVTLALEGGGSAVDKLKSEWDSAVENARNERPQSSSAVKTMQIARMYYEVYVLNVLSNLATYESEYKKQKSLERRKRPKETVERLVVAVSNDCVAALRFRPWSAATWILLGRVFLEVADVALDERESASTTFGLCRPEDLAAGDLGDPVVAILGRAEGCFRLAEALARQAWCPDPCVLLSQFDRWCALDADAYDGNLKDFGQHSEWGCEHDLFGCLGLVDDPGTRVRALRGAVQFGKTAVLVMKLREERHRCRHWKVDTLVPRVLTRNEDVYTAEIGELIRDAQKSLDKGIRYVYSRMSLERSFNSPVNTRNESSSVAVGPGVSADASLTGEFDDKPTCAKSGKATALDLPAFSSLAWYYIMQRAKLYRKRGVSPLEYVDLFASAVRENVKIRAKTGEPPDIEPFYKLHSIRIKLLIESSDADMDDLLVVLERHSFTASEEKPESEVVFLPETPAQRKEDVAERCRAVALDGAQAMQHCRHQKTLHPHSDFFYKAVYYRALALWYVLNDRPAALAELGLMFRGEAAAKAIDPGSDGVHRGYFFTVWNYRYTDSGYETAVESERKYLRWRTKLLGLYGTFLQETGDARILAGAISRLKRDHPDDMPVDGAVLDDFVAAYSRVCLRQARQAYETSELPTVAVSEHALRRTWDVYTETFKLAQEVKRVRSHVDREHDSSGGLNAVLDSRRPCSLVVAAFALHVECMRLRAAIDGRRPDREFLFEQWDDKLFADTVPAEAYKAFSASIEFCVRRWPVESKMHKSVRRRLESYKAGGPFATSASETPVRSDMDAGQTGENHRADAADKHERSTQ